MKCGEIVGGRKAVNANGFGFIGRATAFFIVVAVSFTGGGSSLLGGERPWMPPPPEPPRQTKEEAARLARTTFADALEAVRMKVVSEDSRVEAEASFDIAWTSYTTSRLRLAEEPEYRPSFIITRLRRQPKCDGRLDEWAKVPGIRLNDCRYLWLAGQKDVGKPYRREQWKNPDDLSVFFRAGWNEASLYLAVKVRDDEHVNDNERPMAAWNGDCLQFAASVFAAPEPKKNYKPGDGEWGCAALKGGKVVAWSVCENGKSVNKAMDVPVAVVRDEKNKTTRYEIAVPWKRIGVVPRPGTVFSFTFCVNDRDGKQRLPEKCMALAPGIWEPKFPARFARVVLAGLPAEEKKEDSEKKVSPLAPAP